MDQIFTAMWPLAAFLPLAWLFSACQFSFGYVAAYYSYVMIAGFLWINGFPNYDYNHRAAGLSAFASAGLFLLPALLIRKPLAQPFSLTRSGFNALLIAILVVSLLVIVVAAGYNFHVIDAPAQLREELFRATLRNELQFPPAIRYLLGITSSALLPFAFATFVLQKRYLLAFTSFILLALLFPITLAKMSLFAPFWLAYVALLAALLEARLALVLSVLFPMLIGGVAAVMLGAAGHVLFDVTNFRFMVIPSLAMSVYHDFFARHELTGFCQIGPLKELVSCPYREQLGVVLAKEYHLGNYNGSLFATEGIASVGPALAPVSALFCGVLVAVGNRVSSGLSNRLILISSSILVQAILNVPLSTSLVTHGGGLLFFLWYITPRGVFPSYGDSTSPVRARS
ncbi:hypothetical protein [Bradyrhizobium sp. USDA 4529]